MAFKRNRHSMKPIVELRNITKYFMNTRAVYNLDLSILHGECLGIVGHNGAGKSTMVNILTGTVPATSGELLIDGEAQPPGYDVYSANQQGIRVVFQELSLCQNLTVTENMKVFHPSISGFGWKDRAGKAISDVLDEIFPGHGVHPDSVVSALSLGERQMVEIAKAFSVTDEPLRLVILDEPTSALDHTTSRQLIDYLDSLRNKNVSVIYISHLLDQVLASTDRIVVMKDGVKVDTLVTSETDRDSVIELMGEAKPISAESEHSELSRASVAAKDESEKQPGSSLVEPKRESEATQVTVREGEVVGLTGLAGHGQTDLLLDLFDGKKSRKYRVAAPVSFLPGDRQTDGIFPVWSIAKNICVQVYKKIQSWFLIEPSLESKLAEKWKQAIDIKATSLDAGILSLSGGNQQKTLFARCLESSAQIVLMDDPTRGVDVGTKEVIYRLIVEEKEKGRSFVWYTTEMDELQFCDRLYVFKGGQILAELSGGEASEEDILKASL